MKTEILKYAPIVGVVMVGVTASELVTKDKGTLVRVGVAFAAGVVCLIAAAKLNVIK